MHVYVFLLFIMKFSKILNTFFFLKSGLQKVSVRLNMPLGDSLSSGASSRHILKKSIDNKDVEEESRL